MRNFENFKYYNNITDQNKETKKKFFKQLEKDFIKELVNSEQSNQYLEQFRNTEDGSFIRSYVKKKIELIKNYEELQELYSLKENKESRYQRRAESTLNIILQKKLFNLQIQWRAEEIELPDVEICNDFYYWGKFIRSCPFIPEITAHELQLMKNFLLTINDHEEFDPISDFNWQSYNDFLEIDEENESTDMPQWYNYYDTHMGTSSLLLLPDIIGKKEDLYRYLFDKKFNRLKTEPNEGNIERKPFITSFGQDLVDYARAIETDPYILELFKYYESKTNDSDEEFDRSILEAAVKTLFSADRPIHFDPIRNWDEALLSAAFRYENIRTVEALDFAYSEYLMYRDLGIQENATDFLHYNKYIFDHVRRVERRELKKGRKLSEEDDNQ